MNIMIASLRFAPGHIAHLIAYYQMLRQMGRRCALFAHEKYRKHLADFHIPTIHTYTQAVEWKPDVILAYNSSAENLKLAGVFKNKCLLLCVIHEPYPGLAALLQGKTATHIATEAARNIVDFFTCRAFDRIILPSAQAEKAYAKYSKPCNSNYVVYPLIFPDLYAPEPYLPERGYFSFIGRFSSLHGNEDFLQLVRYAKNMDISFKIATSTRIDSALREPVIADMINSGQLVVNHGRPMSIEEINRHYLESVCVWNVYARSMQSGVAGNAFMMGIPVIASRAGSFEEYVTEGKTGFFADDPGDFEKIIALYRRCLENRQLFSKNCRAEFFRKYHYSAHMELFNRIIERVC